jgi:hypothetical protein
MRAIAAKDAKNNFGEMLHTVKREPLTIEKTRVGSCRCYVSAEVPADEARSRIRLFVDDQPRDIPPRTRALTNQVGKKFPQRVRVSITGYRHWVPAEKMHQLFEPYNWLGQGAHGRDAGSTFWIELLVAPQPFLF